MHGFWKAAKALSALWSIIGLFSVLLYCPGPAQAHEVRPALLKITEDQPGWYEVVWKVPVVSGKVLGISAVLPDTLNPVGPISVVQTGAAQVESAVYKTETDSIVGKEIFIDGLNVLQVDVVVQISLADGIAYSTILKPSLPRYTVPKNPDKLEVFKSYLVLGVEHILSGIDHLLFVLALILIIKDRWRLLMAITAFTVAHSITLALAALGAARVPSQPTEAVIALSILFLAVEIVRMRNGRIGITERAPWIVAFLFGLIHGLGFAGALSEVGLPQSAIPLALFSFNVGVELGQLTFVAVVIAVGLGLQILVSSIGSFLPALQRSVSSVSAYCIGGVATFWLVERLSAF
ncbi:HupE / UreJ protein [Roseibium album]|nr:HupE / UreJ protein [Roseibium album]